MNPQEYFQISANGVTCIREGGRSDFASLEEWDRERTGFDTLCMIGFFNKFIIARTFRKWHKVSQMHTSSCKQDKDAQHLYNDSAGVL